MNEKHKIYGENGEKQSQMNSSDTKKCFKVKDPKLSRVLMVQNNVYAVVQGAIGEDRLQETCSFLMGNQHTVILTNSYSSRRLRLAANIALLTSSYLRTCLNKDFVHSGSIGIIWGKHARYVIIPYTHSS